MESIDDLVATYKAGDSTAAERLLEIFSPMVDSYSKLIRYARGNLKLEGNSRFLYSIGHPDGPRGALNWLRRRSKPFQIDEIQQEVKISILECLMNKGKLVGNIHHILARNIKELLGPFEEYLSYNENRGKPVPNLLEQIEATPWEMDLLKEYAKSGMDAKYTAKKMGLSTRKFYRIIEEIKKKNRG